MPLRLGKSIDRVPSIDELTSPRLQKTGILRDLRFDNVPFGRTQFAPTLWTKSVTVGAQSLRPPIDHADHPK
ncbi:hypothetical protein C789_4753 [Microcystis aeruginosa FACHB-905 = DIANCHI905]|nr:hypothetical protein C789_4753 [Microcystis aeruginosa FACHB-905 = DIANCHI905]